MKHSVDVLVVIHNWSLADLPLGRYEVRFLKGQHVKLFLLCVHLKTTQEVPFEQGAAMLKVFNGFKHVTSIVDDYAHYEATAMQAMQFQRARQNAYGEPCDFNFFLQLNPLKKSQCRWHF